MNLSLCKSCKNKNCNDKETITVLEESEKIFDIIIEKCSNYIGKEKLNAN